MMFACALRHGLIPNLLDSARNPRYNNRDSCWWFIKAIKDYIEFTQDIEILKEKIKMKFLDDNKELHMHKVKENKEKYMLLIDIV